MYSVKQLSKLAGVSIRTLHFYDQIGLLKPSFSKSNGYRFYEEKELIKLQQVLFFKELEFPLEEIKKIMENKNFDSLEALKEQKKLLTIKKQRLEGLIITIDKTIKSKKGGVKMTNDDLYNSFSDDQMNEYKEEAKKRWGHTDAYKQSEERTKNWTKDDYKKVQEQMGKVTQELADAMDEGIESDDEGIESDKVQELVKRHHKSIEVFYDCPLEMYRNLGQMYVADPRFTKFYDKFRKGLAQYICDAIAYYCDNQGMSKK